jgi:3-oxoadipate enol-lactonase
MAFQAAGLNVQDTGEADLPAVLCLHSLFLDHTMFDGLTAAAAGRLRMIRPDFRGQGQSPPAESDVVDMETLADDLEAVLDELGLDAVHVVAQSVGGDVALRLAARRPAAVRSLVLLGSSARAEPPENVEAFTPIAEAVAQQGFTGETLETTMAIMFGASIREDPARADVVAFWRARIAALPKALAPAIRGTIQRASVVDLLPQIQAPALVVSGTEDVARPPAWADEVVADLPNAELWRLEGVGHSPTLEVPGIVEPAVLAFLERMAAATAATPTAPSAPA